MTDGQEPKPETAYSTSSMTTGSGSQAIRLVTAQDSFRRVSHFEDLTLHSCPASPSSTSCGLRVVAELREFDMSAKDDDDRWTLSPSVKQHLRAVSNMNACDDDTSVCDVILDSGADTSALPLKYGHVGVEGPAVDTCYVDAQGAPLTVQSTRLANVQFGDVTFKERFIVSDVTCPLLSLGSVLRAGWNIVHIDGTPHLVKDDMKISSVSFTFRDDELDELEAYEMNFENNELYDDSDWIDDEAIVSQLTFPFSKHEPSLDDAELQRLDALADSLEIQRLTKMAVLTDATTMPSDAKQLSTRFVRTWREKLSKGGQQIWLRRSRFVAREFAWMDSERDSLFSSASSSVVARLLPVMYLNMKQHAESVMASIDVKDAFLTVKQKTPTVVTCKLADGREVQYGLGRVWPGGRDGSLLWHQDITKVLCEELGMSQHVPYPCILKIADNSCFVLFMWTTFWSLDVVSLSCRSW